MEIVILTGMSGAGKTTALSICQDNDYYAVDNLPPSLIKKNLEVVSVNSDIKKFAYVVDIRVGTYLEKLEKIVEELRKENLKVKLVFLDADDDDLVKRFNEKRRPHPIKNMTLENSIKLEREKLKRIKEISDYYINTSGKNLWSIKNSLKDILNISSTPSLTFVSFGYKNGILKEADYIFDVRFIPNPYYVKEIKDFNGTDLAIINYVNKFSETEEFIEKIENLINFLVEKFEKSGKSNLVIGVGCTGGKHRSVVISESLNNIFKNKFESRVYHRDSNLW